MTPQDAATLQALIEAIDLTARQHERTWGLDRLPSLVPTDLRARFYRQQAKWSEAVNDAYELQRPLTLDEIDQITATTAALQRGWAAMAASAEQEGHEPISATVWEMRLSDGSKAALVRTVAEAAHVLDTGRYVAVWTLDEIVNVIAVNLSKAIVEAKAVRSRTKTDRSWVREGDDIPFGSDERPDVLADFD